MVREPAVAGQFYPGGREELKDRLEELLPGREGSAFIGAVAPHAGYMFSGKTAGEVYSRIALPPAVLLLGPNHTGMGSPASVWARGSWKTPIGEVKVEEELAGRIVESSSILEEDYGAHIYEHSLEVQLPFLKHLRDDVRIVPVSLSHFSFEECAAISGALLEGIMGAGGQAALIASSDMSHYEPEKQAMEKDKKAVAAMLSMDEEELYRVVRDEGISMCGYVPAVILLMTVKKLGARKAELAEYSTSARASGDHSSVVGYCGIVFR